MSHQVWVEPRSAVVGHNEGLRPSRPVSVSRGEAGHEAAARIGGNRGADAKQPGGSAREAGAGLLLVAGAGGLLSAVGEGRLLPDGGACAEVGVPVPLAAVAAIERVRPTTESAWTEFHDRLRSFVARRVRHVADAEDIVQHVFLQLHRTLPSVRDTDRLGAWLYQASRNAISDYFRAPATHRELPAGDTRVLDVRDDAERSAEGERSVEIACAAECLHAVAERLPPVYRAAVERVEFEGLTQRAAAQALGLSVSGMKARVQRARRKLKALLLEHCRVELDRRGGVVACAGQRPCGCVPSPPAASFGNEGQA